MTTPLLLAVLVAAPPGESPPRPRHGAAAGLRLPFLVGEPATVAPRLGVGLDVRLESAPEHLPVRLHASFGHDRFARTVELSVETGDPAEPTVTLVRTQRLTYTSFLAGVAMVGGRGRVRPRLAVSAGGVVAFFLHPGAEPTSASAWRLLARGEAAVDFRLVRHVHVELAGEYNTVLPIGEATLDLGAGAGRQTYVLFDDYPAGSVRVTYVF